MNGEWLQGVGWRGRREEFPHATAGPKDSKALADLHQWLERETQ
jgi:hypothetical protein